MNKGTALSIVIFAVPIAKLLYCFATAHWLSKRHVHHGSRWAMLRRVIMPFNRRSDDRDLNVDLISIEKRDLLVNSLLAIAATVAIAVILIAL